MFVTMDDIADDEARMRDKHRFQNFCGGQVGHILCSTRLENALRDRESIRLSDFTRGTPGAFTGKDSVLAACEFLSSHLVVVSR